MPTMPSRPHKPEEVQWFVRASEGGAQWLVYERFGDGAVTLDTATDGLAQGIYNVATEGLESIRRKGFIPYADALTAGVVDAVDMPPEILRFVCGKPG